MTITLLLLLWEFLQIKFVLLMIFKSINKHIFLCILYNSSLGVNQHELYFATSFYDDTTT